MAFIRVVRFTLSAEARSKAQDMGDDLTSAIKERPGCSGVYFCGDSDGECALLVHWNSQEEADAAAVVIAPRLNAHLAGNVVRPADIHLLPVLAS